MTITVLGFVTLPTLPAGQVYTVVSNPQGSDGKYAVQNPNGNWISIQPNGSVDTRPPTWPLGGYELASLVPAGLRYDPIPGASYLIAAVSSD